jgi:hypothetical protein
MSIKEIHNMDPKYKQCLLFEEYFVELKKHVKGEKISVKMDNLSVKLYHLCLIFELNQQRYPH